MRADYERNRIVEQIKRLESEQEQLVHTLMRTERDEKFELERIKNDFEKRISSMQFRKSSILIEISNKKRELVKLDERNSHNVQKAAVSPAKQAREDRLRPHM